MSPINLPRPREEYGRALHQLEQADRANWKLTGDINHPYGLTVRKRTVFPFVSFAANDATPSVSDGKNFKTANSSSTTITALDDGVDGQEVLIWINDANTTVDFTGTTLKGNAGADWTPANGDFMRCTCQGTNWLCSVHDAT